MDWRRKTLARRVGNYDKKTVFIHTLVAVGATLLITVLDRLLMHGLETATGLSSLNSRAKLETAQILLRLLGVALLPFWEIGFVYTALKMSRGQQASTDDLKEGFRRFFPVLRLLIMKLVLCIAAIFIAVQVSMMIFLYTPLSLKLTALVEPLAESGMDAYAIVDSLPMAELQAAILPALILFGVIFLAIMLPVLYRTRLANMILMDNPGSGAFAALRQSNGTMKHNCFRFLRVDLHFWWYYALQALTMLLCYGDILLRSCGVALPLSGDAGFFLCYGLYSLAQLALLSLFRGRVQITYSLIYDDLKEQI